MKVNMDSKLLKGDIITEVNREKVTSTQQFITLIKSIKDTGRNSLLLKILRNNNSEWITIKFKD